MNKKTLMIITVIISIISIFIILIYKKLDNIQELGGLVINYENNILTIEDNNHNIYNIKINNEKIIIGSNIILKYTGSINNNIPIQKINIKDYSIIEKINSIPLSWLDNGIFKKYYINAFHQLQKMTIDEKINQLLLVRYPKNNGINLLKEKQFGGYLFFERDFKNKNISDIQNMIYKLQNVANIPILTAVDEEGGNVVRISNNKLITSEPFKSPRQLYNEGGFELIKKDTIIKSNLLYNLGINLNLAPVIDVSTNANDYIYKRSLGLDTELTCQYAKTVINASKEGRVSYTLKHFPGYGNNKDTHKNTAIDNRNYEEILNIDIPPFIEGIKNGAEAILVSHNIVTSIDDNNPASLSLNIHNLLRKDLEFTGIIITDDLIMNAVSNIKDTSFKAIKAGNDLLITSNYEESINSIKEALNNNKLSQSEIDEKVFRILAWKYYKGLIQ